MADVRGWHSAWWILGTSHTVYCAPTSVGCRVSGRDAQSGVGWSALLRWVAMYPKRVSRFASSMRMSYRVSTYTKTVCSTVFTLRCHAGSVDWDELWQQRPASNGPTMRL